MWCGGPSRRRLPSSIPAGYVSQTGYQYDSISRVAGQREPAPPSNFSKLGGFNNNVFIADAMYYNPLRASKKTYELQPDYQAPILLDFHSQPKPSFSRGVLLKHLRQLAGGLQQRQLTALAREIRVQESHPLVIFIQANFLDIAQRGAALVEFSLDELDGLLRQLQIQARDLARRVQFAHILRFLANVQADFLPLISERQFGKLEFTFSQGHIGARFGRVQRNGNLHAGGDVVTLKPFVEFGVIVDGAQEAVLADYVHRGPKTSARAAQDFLPRQAIVFRFLNAAIALHGQIGQLVFLLIGSEGRLVGVHLNRLRVADAGQVPDLLHQSVVAPFQLDDALLDARRG